MIRANLSGFMNLNLTEVYFPLQEWFAGINWINTNCTTVGQQLELFICVLYLDIMQRKVFPPDLEFEFLEEIGFQSEREKLEILARGLQEFQRGHILESALQAGRQYREEVLLRVCPNISVRFVSERVGHGVFAEEGLREGCYVGEYTGIVRENVRI